MNEALIRVSLNVIASHFFEGAVTIKAAFLDTDDLKRGTITFLIAGDGLPPLPAPGERYPVVTASIATSKDDGNLVPKETHSVTFQRVT